MLEPSSSGISISTSSTSSSKRCQYKGCKGKMCRKKFYDPISDFCPLHEAFRMSEGKENTVETCSICWESIENPSRAVTTTSCGHKFHSFCIFRHIRVHECKRERDEVSYGIDIGLPTCPNCRAEIPENMPIQQ